MPEPLGHDSDVDSGGQLQRSGAVTQIVQSLHGQPRPRRDHLELPSHVLRADAPPERVGEHAVVLWSAQVDVGELVELCAAVPNEKPDGAAVQVEAAMLPAARLGRTDDLGAVDNDDLLSDGQLCSVQVDVLPTEPDRFPAA